MTPSPAAALVQCDIKHAAVESVEEGFEARDARRHETDAEDALGGD